MSKFQKGDIVKLITNSPDYNTWSGDMIYEKSSGFSSGLNTRMLASCEHPAQQCFASFYEDELVLVKKTKLDIFVIIFNDFKEDYYDSDVIVKTVNKKFSSYEDAKSFLSELKKDFDFEDEEKIYIAKVEKTFIVEPDVIFKEEE